MGTGPFHFFRCKAVTFGGSSTLLKGNQMSRVLINPFPPACKIPGNRLLESLREWSPLIPNPASKVHPELIPFQRALWFSLSRKPGECLCMAHKSCKEDDSLSPWESRHQTHKNEPKTDSIVIKWLKFTPPVTGRTDITSLPMPRTEKDATTAMLRSCQEHVTWT